MKPLYLLVLISTGLNLIGCTTATQPDYTKNKASVHTALNKNPAKTPKSPFSVAMYESGQKPIKNYKILGTETISKFNFSGIKRQTASIHDAMRNMAAKMGGDAIINIAYDDKSVTGTVIKYENKTTA